MERVEAQYLLFLIEKTAKGCNRLYACEII